ncbi:hypothetical protein IT570_11885 [Candidatus Sumerlaeota bacterium]|nr:hypothetical protein [Candidatus Sumerlaeota bacterium]
MPARHGASVASSGELSPPEFVFRAGLLLVAAYFFHQAVGFPWNRNFFGIAAILLSLLMTTTMVFQWKALGDWRRHSQQVLYVLLVIALTFPIAAALSPSLGRTVLPDFIENPLIQFFAAMRKIPGVSLIASFTQTLLSFVFFVATLAILITTSRGTRRGGLMFILGIQVFICLFFYPVLEMVAGIAMMLLFFKVQWERPLMISDHVRAHLRPAQLDFLRLLMREGSLSAGETRVLLQNESRYFSELLDFHLVRYDAMEREVTPGKRLQSDEDTAPAEKAFAVARRGLWFIVGVAYFLMPDFLPGPFDDLVVLGLCLLSGFNFAKLFGPND